MKHKIAVALVAVIVVAVSLAAFAEKQVSGGKVILLKSGSELVAELHVRSSAKVTLQCSTSTPSSADSDYNMKTGALVATGGAILKLSVGTNSITVRADEIQSVPEPERQ
jgi:hypothetical protein